MTRLVHGDEGIESAQRATKILFGGELGDTSDPELREIFADVPSSEVSADQLSGDGFWIIEALQTVGHCKSGGEARRSVKEGSVYLNNVRVTDEQLRIGADSFEGRSVVVIRRGKKKYALLSRDS